MNIIVVMLVLYIGLMIGIGVFFSKTAGSSNEEYYLGGRKIGPLVTAVAAGSTGRSAWLILGMVGTGYTFGAGAIWSVAVYAITEMFAMAYAGRRLRIFTEKTNSLTWPDYLENRFEDKKNILRLTAVIIMVVFYVTYTASQLKGSTKMFSAVFGMEPITAIILSAAVVIIYTMTGGYRAVIYTSFIQGALMMFSLVFMPIFLIVTNLDKGIISTIMAAEPGLITSPVGLASGAWLTSQILVGFGSWGQVHILSRYMSTRKPSEMRKTAFGNGIWNIVCAAGACFTGLLARVVWPAQDMLQNGDAELVTPMVAGLMHPIIGGIIIAGVISAIMSTIDSMLLTSTTALTKDLYQKIINKDATDKQVIRLGRIAIVVIGVIAIFFALSDNQSIYWFVLFAFGGMGACFGPVFLLSTYWKGMTKWGALVGMIVGLVVTVVWYYTPALKSMIYELVPAFILACISIVVVSKLTAKDKPKEVDALFDTLNTYVESD